MVEAIAGGDAGGSSPVENVAELQFGPEFEDIHSKLFCQIRGCDRSDAA